MPVILGMLLLAVGHTTEPDDAELESRGRAAYLQGVESARAGRPSGQHFAAAAAAFGTLRDRGFHGDALAVAHGDAALLANQLPEAIQAYRSALQQNPENDAARRGLELARSRVAAGSGDAARRMPVDHWPPALPRVAPAWALPTSVGLQLVAWLLLARWVVRREMVLLYALFLLVPAVLLGCWPVVDRLRALEARASPLVVVRVDGSVLRQGNGTDYLPRSESPLLRGQEATLRFRRGSWIQVELPSGEIGWLPGEACLVDSTGDR